MMETQMFIWHDATTKRSVSVGSKKPLTVSLKKKLVKLAELLDKHNEANQTKG